ncbi:MAG: hypothetical protein IJF03_04725 [Lachnospiraceae bacterium]|nr:hypothetical protein [Lachnospiraceae bacterium]
MSENRNKQGGGALIWIVILACIFYSCKDDSDNSSKVSNKVNEVVEETKENVKKNKIVQEDYKKKFSETATIFYNTYLTYFGEDFSIEDEPFENGKYIGEYGEQYYELGILLDDMCYYYENIDDYDDRYEMLDELELTMHSYVHNICQMMILVYDRSPSEYEETLFFLEYNDYIIC